MSPVPSRVAVAGRRCAAVVALAASVAAAAGAAVVPTAATAAVRSALNEERTVRMTLDGRVFVATRTRVEAQDGDGPREPFVGREVAVACGTTFREGPHGPPRGSRVGVNAHWEAGSRTLRVRFRRDVSARVRWCVVEPRRGDEAFFGFVRAEPPRGIARGTLADGTPWRLRAWRGERAEPCYALRFGSSEMGAECFFFESEREARVTAEIVTGEGCPDGAPLVGTAPRAARTMRLTLRDGTTLEVPAHRRPAWSRMRAALFFAELPAGGDPARVVALDARGAPVGGARFEGGASLCPVR